MDLPPHTDTHRHSTPGVIFIQEIVLIIAWLFIDTEGLPPSPELLCCCGAAAAPSPRGC